MGTGGQGLRCQGRLKAGCSAALKTHSERQKMIVYGSAGLAETHRRVVDVKGEAYYRSEWLESSQDPWLSPTVFMVEQPPNASLAGHFHAENQFQIFVGGEGRIGAHTISPMTVHYAGAYSGYGPLIAGPQGIRYFTIRSVYETGMMSSTDSSKMVRGPKRHLVTEPQPAIDAAVLAALTRVETDELIALQPDGIAVSLLRLPAGASGRGLDPASGGGQFFLVLGGELLHGDKALHRWESMFASCDEAAVLLRAGEGGLEVLLLQMAPKDPAYIVAKKVALEALQTAGAPAAI